tara:strand:- start:242 stop:1297 length:1056 start_codon:yes stop_codon:yes gene_type:complete
MFLRESAGMFNSNASPGAQSTDNLFAKLDEGREKEMSVANLQYPSNLGVDEQHSWILFEIKETDSAKFTTTRNDQNVGTAIAAAALGTVLQGGDGSMGSIAGAGAKAAGVAALAFSADDIFGALKTNATSEESIYTQPQKPVERAIALYMPKSITNSDGFEYTSIGTGKMRDVAAFTGAVGNIFGGISTAQTQETKMAFEIGALEKTSDAAAAVRQKALGATINPRMEQLFKGVSFREFSFEFEFTPRDLDEYTMAREIIRTFRKHAYPELSSGGRFYIMPSEFLISYQYQSGKNKHLHKFRPCVISKIDVDFAGAEGWNILPDGRPASMKLSLTFKETTQLTRQQVERGH